MERLRYKNDPAAYLSELLDPQVPIRVETDASDVARAAILSQADEQGRYHPVAFWCSKFKGLETRYSTPDKELMAIVDAFKHWRHYLEGSTHTVEVLSDHHNLQGFMSLQKLNEQQARWRMSLAPIDFVINYQAGKRNPTDGPSRRPDNWEEAVESPKLLPTLQMKMGRGVTLGILTSEGVLRWPNVLESDGEQVGPEAREWCGQPLGPEGPRPYSCESGGQGSDIPPTSELGETPFCPKHGQVRDTLGALGETPLCPKQGDRPEGDRQVQGRQENMLAMRPRQSPNLELLRKQGHCRK